MTSFGDPQLPSHGRTRTNPDKPAGPRGRSTRRRHCCARDALYEQIALTAQLGSVEKQTKHDTDVLHHPPERSSHSPLN